MINATIGPVKDIPISLYFNMKDNVLRLDEGVVYECQNVYCVAAIHPASDIYGVKTMNISKFREVGESVGSALQI